MDVENLNSEKKLPNLVHAALVENNYFLMFFFLNPTLLIKIRENPTYFIIFAGMKAKIQILDKTFVPFITEDDLNKRISELATTINQHYSGKQPVLLTILNGSFMFAADLFRKLEVDVEIAFIRLASYSGLSSSGKVREIIGLDKDLSGRDIILLEDIIDTGRTLHHFIPQLQSLEPASIKVMTLLFKPEALQHPLSIDWVGFEIENKFVLGYGLDYDEKGRNLPCIYQLAEE